MFCTGDICRYHASVYLLPFILTQAQTADLAILTQEFLGCNAEFTQVLLKFMDSLLLTVIRFKDTRELRPGIICCAAVRQTGIDFQLTHAAAALTDNGCHAIIAGITAADDHNILILGINSKSVLQLAVQQALGYAFQIILSEINASQLASGNRQITWHCRTGTQHYGIIFLQQCAGSKLYANLAVQDKFYTGVFQQLDAPLYQLFVQFHIRNTVHQQTAGTVGTLVNSNAVTGLVQLISTGKAGRSAADNRNLFAAALSRLIGFYQSMLEGVFNDILLNVANGNRIVHQTCIAGTFAGSRADMRCKFREIIGFIQTGIGIIIHPVINKIIKFRHQIVQRTA